MNSTATKKREYTEFPTANDAPPRWKSYDRRLLPVVPSRNVVHVGSVAPSSVWGVAMTDDYRCPMCDHYERVPEIKVGPIPCPARNCDCEEMRYIG